MTLIARVSETTWRVLDKEYGRGRLVIAIRLWEGAIN